MASVGMADAGAVLVSRLNAAARPTTRSSRKRRRPSDSPPPGHDRAHNSRGPSWQGLPYHVWLRVFTLASEPLHNEHFGGLPSVGWLVRVARTCKSFHEPALTVLYRCPPLGYPQRPHDFIRLVALPSETVSLPYASKVRGLEIEAQQTLMVTTPGEGRLDLAKLISHLPQLERLEIFHVADRVPYRDAPAGPRWAYPDALFQAMERSGIFLRSWRWNGKFIVPLQPPRVLSEIHQTRSFHYLERLAMVNYKAPLRRMGQRESASAELANAIMALRRLQHLRLESCQLIDEELLERLPSQLHSFAVVHCENVTSDVLRTFLLTGGAQLRELILLHNPSLNLFFLPDLAASCPSLEVLKIDLQYYSHVSTLHAMPKYEHLLLPEQIPTWPSSLQVIECLQLRNWTQTSAEGFFESLARSAASLPFLRRLLIAAILKVEWRDRAKFRQTWTRRLERIFRRRVHPSPLEPSPAKTMPWPDRGAAEESVSSARRRSVRASGRQRENRGTGDSAGVETRDRRTRASTRDQLYGPRSEPNQPPVSAGADDDDVELGYARQGKCDVVDIVIDNVRPMEIQYKEEDFLDEEISGDEDWDGDDGAPSDDGYAW
ncbi:MAG: hypothetical protein M1838_000058 [Thelocarpon superellum]|nr:MAG: hypothetical protein M1838_000058 [Thelocarpon superellum]